MASSKGIDYLKIINGSVQSKTYSFVIFTVIVVIVLLIGAVRPTLLTITKINKDIKEKKLINTQLDTKLQNLSTLSNQYGSIKSDADTLPLMFPTQGNFSLFMSNIEEISKANGFTLNGINFNKNDDFIMKLKVLKPWSARITVSGKKANIIKLLKAYESMPMYPVVNQLSYSNKQDESNQTTFSINLIVFRIDDPNFYN
ncbi:MAG: hypothetical protein UT34_C0002G0030 [candidate division WS6 bacterium GW2011_GWF2_39_15]|uniref:Uncharacterized protein n=1 Tax=candidate division WS6 bacterium GW2011_GWF2_39_15 TaxID=1619100 RepID=A0A0G0MQV9_9BACT|nr:MAG: hypothetical protein UT34_C0002G0030 [candidate division WS6 bacterium GW2011_GWF2_39_15]